MMGKRSEILDTGLGFALPPIWYCMRLSANRKYGTAGQLPRSGTLTGVNIREEPNAESRQNRIHKFKIAAKEAGEIKYSLLLFEEAKKYLLSEKPRQLPVRIKNCSIPLTLEQIKVSINKHEYL